MFTLKHVLGANAASCLGFGFIFLLAPSAIATYLAQQNPAPEIIITAIGAGLIFHGLHLAWASLLKSPSSGLVLYFSVGDLLWVLATGLLIAKKVWISSPEGVATALLVSLLVGILGAFQYIKHPMNWQR